MTRDQMVADFAAVTMTTPEKAAEIIHRGVEAGKSRILVGSDAYLFDLLTRLAPTRYMEVMDRFEGLINGARRARAVKVSVF